MQDPLIMYKDKTKKLQFTDWHSLEGLLNIRQV